MNKLLITGLNLIKISKENPCCLGDYDYSWLLDCPSILLWVDKILLAPEIRKEIASGNYPSNNLNLAKSIKLTFEIIEDQGLVEEINVDKILSSDISNEISKQVDRDIIVLPQEFQNVVHIESEKNKPELIIIGKYHYCDNIIWSIRAYLLIAQALNTFPLFNQQFHNYCKYIFFLSGYPKEEKTKEVKAFNKILQVNLPNKHFFPYFLFGEECKTCKRKKYLEDNFLSELEENLIHYLKWRDHDELHQLRDIITMVSKSKERREENFDHNDIILELKDIERKISKRIYSIFPKVNRGLDLVQTLSICTAIVGCLPDYNIPILGSASAIGLAAKGSEKYIKYLSSKYKWVTYFNKEIKL